MMGVVSVAAVSYLNTIPFVYGIDHAEVNLCVDLLLATPSQCVENFKSKNVDIALVPVGALGEIEDGRVITSYCLSAEGAVTTVELLSNSDITEIDIVYLDSHSRTSNLLVQYLCKKYWNITPEFRVLEDISLVEPEEKGVGYLMIGDKVFDHRGRFAYDYDLASSWQEHTGLPFVFAVWVARNGVSQQDIDSLERMLGYGVDNIESAVRCYRSDKCYDDNIKYLTENIKFCLDENKRLSLELFIRSIKSLSDEKASGG